LFALEYLLYHKLDLEILPSMVDIMIMLAGLAIIFSYYCE